MDEQCKSTIRVATWNAGGLLHNMKFLNNLLDQTDICVITEHWLYPDSLAVLETVHPDFYGWGRASSNLNLDSIWRRGFGGVGFLWRKEINADFKILSDKGNDRIIAAVIGREGTDCMMLVGAYLPSSNTNIATFREYLEGLEDLVNEIKYSGMPIIVGDFNAHIGDYGGSRCLNAPVNERGKELIKFLGRLDLIPVNSLEICTGPVETFYCGEGTSASTIDFIFVEKHSLNNIMSCRVLDDHCANLSSHLPIVCLLSFSLSCYPEFEKRRNSINVTAWKVVGDNAAVRQSYQEAISHKLNKAGNIFADIHCVDRLENAVLSLCEILKSAEKETIPKTKFRTYLKPFWKGLKPLHDHCRRCRSDWIRHGRSRDKNNKFFKEYKEAKRLFRREMRRKQQEEEAKKFESLEEIFEFDRSGFYKALAKLRKVKGKSCSSLRVNGKIVTDDTELLSVWKDHYADLYTPLVNPRFDETFKEHVEEEIQEFMTQSYEIMDDVLDEPFTSQHVASVCARLPNGKSGGPDKIVYEHVKFAGQAFHEVLCSIFNAARSLEDVSDSFKIGLIQNLFKVGKKDKQDKDNYRGITLLNVFGKIFERIILDLMLPKLEPFGIPNKFQFAYQKNKSCVTASFVMQEAISHYVERGSRVYCCFLDTSKAFDTVWVDGLFYKLFKAGIRGKAWRLLYNWYSNLSCCVMHSNKVSSKFVMSQGVRQGGVLSPWLYLIYNNDIPEALNIHSEGLSLCSSSCDSVLVADDVALLSSRVDGLQRMITAMENYGRRWRFLYNVSKTRIITFGESTRRRNINKLSRKWILDGVEIMESADYTHVGIKLSGNFSSITRTEEMAKKGREVVSSIMTTGIRPGGMNPIIGANVWLIIGLPRMLYGCELWNNLSVTELEILSRTHRFAAKRIQGLGAMTRSEAATGSVGLWTVQGYIDKKKLLFLGNLCRSEYNTLTKEVFILRLYSFIYGCAKEPLGFIPDIYRILLKYDLVNWLNEYILIQTFPSKMQWKKIVIARINDIELLNWRLGISVKPELEIYGYVHSNIQPLSLWETAKRNGYAIKPICNLVNILCGNIPTGLQMATEEALNDCMCKLCKNRISNIPMHFVMHCPIVCREREDMWNELHDILDTRSCAVLWNQDDFEIYSCLVSGRIPRNTTLEELDKFAITVAVRIIKIIKGVSNALTEVR